MKKLLMASTTLLLGGLAATGAVAPAHSATASGAAPGATSAASPLSGTFMVGDSTTYRIAPDLQSREPDWYLDFRRGRSIRTLPSHIEAYLRVNPRPANFVMALGTNRCHDPDWSEARLRRAIAKLPRRTNVFLVMVVRTGEFQADKDAVLREYNRYSRDLAKDRPHTYVIDWRGAVLADPTLNHVTGISSLLEDGTHESGGPHGKHRGPGVDTYIDLVVSTWEQVNGSGS
jgi:hypothetical protein